jgi:hypothetical protein
LIRSSDVFLRNIIPVSISNPIRSGRCFNYNEKGHWRRECLKQTVEHRNKINICTFRSTSIESSTPTSICILIFVLEFIQMWINVSSV